jgi:hypothetical protein
MRLKLPVRDCNHRRSSQTVLRLSAVGALLTLTGLRGRHGLRERHLDFVFKRCQHYFAEIRRDQELSDTTSWTGRTQGTFRGGVSSHVEMSS